MFGPPRRVGRVVECSGLLIRLPDRVAWVRIPSPPPFLYENIKLFIHNGLMELRFVDTDRPPLGGPVRMLVHCFLLGHCRLEVERSGTGRRQWRRRGFRGWRSVAEAAVRADRVVMPPPGFDQYLGFGEAVEDLTVEQFVTQ